MLKSMKTLKSLGWSAVLALLFVPGFVISLLLLPWIPLVARGADAICRRGALWMGVEVPYRKASRWFDWPQFFHLVMQLVLAAAAFFTWVSLGFFAGVLVAIPFLPVGELSLGEWSTSNPILIFVVSWGLGAIAIGLLMIFSRLLSAASIAVVRFALSPSDKELAASRATLIDAFSGERRRIERELHDGPQQYLTALKLNLATAKLHYKNQASPEAMETALEDAEHNASQALRALRATVRGIAPQVLFDRGLVAALEELIAHAGVDAVMQVEGSSTELDETMALLAYHCVAEALTNATKHGEAQHVDVKVAFSNWLRVSITDDGLGFIETPSEDSRDLNGTGIAGLRERAAALGGTVKLQNIKDGESSLENNSGARLILELPLSESPKST